MSALSRRTLLRGAAAAGYLGAAAGPELAHAATAQPPRFRAPAPEEVPLTWLEGATPAVLAAGATFGVPWPRGAVGKDQSFAPGRHAVPRPGRPSPPVPWLRSRRTPRLRPPRGCAGAGAQASSFGKGFPARRRGLLEQ
jgi:hypothetical protein